MLEKTLESPLDSKEIQPVNHKGNQLNIHRKDCCWSSKTLATWCKELNHWGWERLRAGGKGVDSGWDGWMASLTQQTWVWANSRRQWRTGKPGVLQSMRLQRIRQDLAAEQQQEQWKLLSWAEQELPGYRRPAWLISQPALEFYSPWHLKINWISWPAICSSLPVLLSCLVASLAVSKAP